MWIALSPGPPADIGSRYHGMEGLTTVSSIDAHESCCVDGLRVAPLESKMRSLPATLALALCVSACGSSNAGNSTPGVDVTFEIMKGGMSVPCSSAPEIT